MKFEQTNIEGAYVLSIEPIRDDRGFFARSWCRDELADRGLCAEISQINIGLSEKARTLRGMHYQLDPSAEVKIVSCPRGSVFDVIVDLRPESETFLRWFGTELSLENGRMMYAPEGCAHGYLTLQDDTLLVYSTSKPYAPDLARGVRWDDREIGIEWPAQPSVISDADRNWPLQEHS